MFLDGYPIEVEACHVDLAIIRLLKFLPSENFVPVTYVILEMIGVPVSNKTFVGLSLILHAL